MSRPTVAEADLAELSHVFPDLDFSDPERRTALLETGSRDIHAAPGSGKTTLLAAKLYLLLRQWPHERRGLCVISHTNVAAEEITHRLLATSEGSRLLTYPHFVGTIHAFINRFLALPLLHSWGIPVEIIDNDVFAKHALAYAEGDFTLKCWLKNNPKTAAPVISTLCYQGEDLEVEPLEGAMVKTTAKSHAKLLELKKVLTQRGVHRFEDMFAYAEVLLGKVPYRRERLSHRFPIVLVDEMQDTSWAQEELIVKMFDASVVVQRFGDLNQRILTNERHADRLTFPATGHLNISTSKRFSSEIAAVASAVQLTGSPIVGQGTPPVAPPTLLLYEESAVEKVIPYFGQLVLRTFSEDALVRGVVKAICTRKQCDAQQALGRHLGDYWPAFTASNLRTSPNQDLAWTLLADKNGTAGVAFGLDARVSAIHRVLLLALRASSSNFGHDVRDARRLLRDLERDGQNTTDLRRAVRYLAVTRNLNDAGRWGAVTNVIFTAMRPLLPATMTELEFSNLPLFKVPVSGARSGVSARECVVNYAGRTVHIQLDTVAGVKGETHLATLVLESHGGMSKRFDIAMALVNLSGVSKVQLTWSPLIKGQYRNMYVAMSRPSHMLCLAMNKARAEASHVALLKTQGWDIIDVV